MSTVHDGERWLIHYRRSPKANLRLFCFPYAGGGPIVFRSWPDKLPSAVEVFAVHLPGRGNRLNDPLHSDIPSLAEALLPALSPYLDTPFVFFGHSLGAIIAFELARRLRNEHGLEPAHLFASARRAPHVPSRETLTHNLPEAEFIEKLRQLNGTPSEIIEHAELIRLMIPTLRADFALSETYVYSAEPPLSCPITALGGLKDQDVTKQDLEAWGEHTTSSFALKMLPGDHFFLRTYESALLQIILEQLLNLLASPAGDK